MFDLYEWDVGGQLRREEDLRRAERARLLAELRRSRPRGPSVRWRVQLALASLLIRCGRLLQGESAPHASASDYAPAADGRHTDAAAPLSVGLSGAHGARFPV
jgi:hypothetical protein